MTATRGALPSKARGERTTASILRRCYSILLLAVLSFASFYLLMMMSAGFADQRAIHLYASGQDARPHIPFIVIRIMAVLFALFGTTLFVMRLTEHLEALMTIFSKCRDEAV